MNQDKSLYCIECLTQDGELKEGPNKTEQRCLYCDKIQTFYHSHKIKISGTLFKNYN